MPRTPAWRPWSRARGRFWSADEAVPPEAPAPMTAARTVWRLDLPAGAQLELPGPLGRDEQAALEQVLAPLRAWLAARPSIAPVVDPSPTPNRRTP